MHTGKDRSNLSCVCCISDESQHMVTSKQLEETHYMLNKFNFANSLPYSKMICQLNKTVSLDTVIQNK